jgi:hypothetical protein
MPSRSIADRWAGNLPFENGQRIVYFLFAAYVTGSVVEVRVLVIT